VAKGQWLWNAADVLLATGRSAGNGQASAQEHQVFHQAYDQLLCEISTSPVAELAALAIRFYDEPYINLPAPIQVTVWRLVGLEASGNVEQLRAAVAGIAHLCSPTEEAGAVVGIEARIHALGG